MSRLFFIKITISKSSKEINKIDNADCLPFEKLGALISSKMKKAKKSEFFIT